jgi:hypothetical protein
MKVQTVCNFPMTTRNVLKRRSQHQREFLLFSAISAVVLAGIGGFLVTNPFDSFLIDGGTMIQLGVLEGRFEDEKHELEMNGMLPGSLNSSSLVYIHVGKTGGTTLDYVLRSNCYWYSSISKRNICNGALNRQEEEEQEQGGIHTMISKSTKATLHMKPKNEFDMWIDDATAFLVTLRNPIARAVSAFNMQHPNNTAVWRPTKRPLAHMPLLIKFYHGCFPTVEHLATAMERADPQNNCYAAGLDTLIGSGHPKVAPQLRFNYAYYHNMTSRRYPERPVLALRTEHLWDDVKRVDRLLGGSGIFPRAGEARTWGSEQYHVHEGLSPSGVRTFCCILAAELQIYEILLREAVNLSPSEKEMTLIKVYDQCGLNAASVNGKEHFEWVEWANNPESMCPPQIKTFHKPQ